MYTKTSLVLVEDSEKDIKLVLSCAGKVVMQKLERNATQAGIIKAAAEEVPSLSTARGRPSRKYVLGYDGSEEQIQTPIVKDESGPSLRPRRENSTPISRTESHGLSSNQPASFYIWYFIFSQTWKPRASPQWHWIERATSRIGITDNGEETDGECFRFCRR